MGGERNERWGPPPSPRHPFLQCSPTSGPPESSELPSQREAPPITLLLVILHPVRHQVIAQNHVKLTKGNRFNISQKGSFRRFNMYYLKNISQVRSCLSLFSHYPSGSHSSLHPENQTEGAILLFLSACPSILAM